MQSACDFQTKKDKARTTMTTTSQAVCAPTDVCRKRQEPRSPARSRFPGVEGGGLLLYYFLLVSDFVNDVHVENWKGGTVAPVLKIHFAHLLDVERWLQRPLLSSPGRRAPFAGGWRSIEISKLLTIRSKPQLSLTQITWDNSAGPRPSATVRGTRMMSLGWTGWAGGLWGRSGWFGDNDDDEGDDDCQWTGRAESGGCETYHHDDFNSNKFQIRAHDDGNDVCLAGKSVSSGRWREGSGLGSPVGGTGGTPVHWVVQVVHMGSVGAILFCLHYEQHHHYCYHLFPTGTTGGTTERWCHPYRLHHQH